MHLKEKKINSFLLLLLINILGLILYLLIFSPFLSIDDLVAANKVYGCYGGDYDYHHPTISWTYLYLIRCMLVFAPNIPWYTIFLQVLFFVAVFSFTLKITKKYGLKYGIAVSCLIILFYGYEGYIALKYTKTAIVLSTVGVFFVADENEKFKGRIWGVFLLIIGGLIRSNVLMPAYVFGAFYFFANFISEIDRNGLSKEYTKKWLFNIILITLIFISTNFFVNHSNEIFFSKDEQYDEWIQSEELDWRRSYVQDTGVIVSEDAIEEYEENNISENDIYIWKNWNYDWNTVTDNTIKTFEKFNMAYGKKEISNISNQIIQNFLKVFPLSYLKTDVFYLYLILGVSLILSTKNSRKALFNIVLSIIFFMSMNLYLYYQGRYLIHRVDVGIILESIILLGTNALFEEHKINRKFIFSIIICLLLCGNYLNGEDDLNGWNNEQVEVVLENIGKDQNHLYVYCKDARGGVLYYLNAYDVPQKGSLKNFVRGDAIDPETLAIYKNYEIKNPYLDVLDNNNMYLLMDQNNTDEDKWRTYISEHTKKDVELVKVKDYGDIKLYKVISKSIEENIDFSNIKDSDAIEYKIYDVQKDDGTLYISGNSYIDGTTGYSENIYLKVKSQDTVSYYLTLQTLNQNKTSGQDGLYADFSVSIDGIDEGEMPELWLVIENSDGKLFETKLDNIRW